MVTSGGYHGGKVTGRGGDCSGKVAGCGGDCGGRVAWRPVVAIMVARWCGDHGGKVANRGCDCGGRVAWPPVVAIVARWRGKALPSREGGTDAHSKTI